MTKKIITVFFLFLLASIFFCKPNNVLASNSSSTPTIFNPQVTIPGSNFIKGESYEIRNSTASIAEYVKAIYNYLLSIVGITAAIVLMVGGVLWLTAGGSSEKVSQAKSWIGGSLTGLVLALTSYLILQTINPQLVSFTATDVPKIKPIINGCCQYNTLGGTKSIAEQINDVECYQIFISKANPKIAPITSAELNKAPYNGELSKYLGDGRFNSNKRANYSKGICEELGYCEIYGSGYEGNISTRVDATVVTKMSQDQCQSINGTGNQTFWSTGNLIARFYTEEQFKQAGMELLQTLFKKTCEGREGSSCNNSTGVYCYCYGGYAYINRGKINEPCGNDGGKCIPDKDLPDELQTEDQDEFCENKDQGSRSCDGGDLICCEKNGIWGGYNPALNY